MRRRCYASISGRRPAARMPAHSWCRVVTVRRSAGTSARLLSRPWMPPPSAPSSPCSSGTPTSTPARAVRCRAARCTPCADVLARGAVDGRTRAYMESMLALRERQRAAYAERLGADPADVALTTCTSEGVVRVLAGLVARAGRRGPDRARRAPRPARPAQLAAPAARRRRPHRAVRGRSPTRSGARTRLVACSHVSWVTRRACGPRASRDSGRASRSCSTARRASARCRSTCARWAAPFYAGSGQKWLCGPVGTGMLWIAPDAARTTSLPVGATYLNLAEPGRGLESAVHPDAPRPRLARALGRGGRRGASPRSTCSARPAGTRSTSARGRSPPRSPTACASAAARSPPRGPTRRSSPGRTTTRRRTRDRLAGAGIMVRNLPGTPYVRASVGAWNDEDDLDRLVEAAAPA